MAIEIRYDPKRVVNLNNLWTLSSTDVCNAVKAVQDFGAAMRCIKFPQILGRANRTGSYYGELRVYQSQPAELRRATQLEF